MRATYAATADNGAESLIRPAGSAAEPHAEPHATQCAEVPVTAVTVGESPRSTGADEEHIARLAETEEPLPPILVDRRTMRVIDGVHRLAAARRRSQQTISVKFFDGCADDAFLRGVEANVTHGLPLSQADRRAAAARIVATHPHLSDRSIARASGLGAKTVAALRRSSGAGSRDTLRVGGDGRVRPLSSVEGRQRAAEILVEQPQASLREVARMAGISPTTVSDVRKLLEAGRDPRTPGGGLRARAEVNSCLEQGRSSTSITTPITTVATPAGRRVQPHRVDPAAVLQKLVRDPALRQREAGRHLLRLLQHNAVDQHMWADLAAAVPAHAGGLVADLARQYAQNWAALAQELYERSEDLESQRMTG